VELKIESVRSFKNVLSFFFLGFLVLDPGWLPKVLGALLTELRGLEGGLFSQPI
jgi:hypothetical protein